MHEKYEQKNTLNKIENLKNIKTSQDAKGLCARSSTVWNILQVKWDPFTMHALLQQQIKASHI